MAYIAGSFDAICDTLTRCRDEKWTREQALEHTEKLYGDRPELWAFVNHQLRPNLWPRIWSMS